MRMQTVARCIAGLLFCDPGTIWCAVRLQYYAHPYSPVRDVHTQRARRSRRPSAPTPIIKVISSYYRSSSFSSGWNSIDNEFTQ